MNSKVWINYVSDTLYMHIKCIFPAKYVILRLFLPLTM